MLSLYKFKWDEPFLKWLKKFMVWYTLLLSGLITISITIVTPPVPSGLYLIFSSAIGITLLFLIIPLQWFEKILPLTIPGYIAFIHFFMTYTGGVGSPYHTLYFLPVIFASFLFSYLGAVIAIILVMVSHMILESVLLSGIPFYLVSYHFIMHDLPFFIIAVLLGIMGVFLATRLKDDMENLSHLFIQAETAKNAFKRELEITKTLYNMDKVILSTIDKKEILRRCLENLKSLLNGDYISIAIFEPEKEEFKVVTSFSNSPKEEESAIPFDSTIFKSTLSSQVSRYCPEVSSEDLLSGDAIFRDIGIKSLLIVPLISKGSPIGTLNIGSTKKDHFTKDDITLAEGYALQVAIAIDNSNLYENLQNLFLNTVLSFSSAIDAKSRWTQNHSAEVAKYAVAIARRIGLNQSFIEKLRIAVLLHDIGKIGVPDAILDKSSALSKEEMIEMEKHSLYGVAILQSIKEFKEVLPIVRHHHESWDGTGYPDRLSGNKIPLGARILSVADAFESMITDRPYRRGLTIDETKEELLKHSGKQFDPQIVSVLVSILEDETRKGSSAITVE